MTFELISDYNGQNEEIIVKHNVCNKEFKTIPNNFLRRKNKCPHCNDEAFIMNKSKSDIKINNLSSKKDNIIQSKLKKLYNFEFTYLSEDETASYKVRVKHNKCNKVFSDYRKNLYNKKLKCPHCSSSNSLSNQNKKSMYEEKLDYKFELLEDFNTTKDKILIKKNSCGHTFKKSLNQLLKGQQNCPECSRIDRLNKLKDKLKNKYGDRYICTNGEAYYKNNQSNLIFLDTECNNVFQSSFTKILNTNSFPCPSCSATEKNISNKVRNEVFKKFKGEYLMLSEYVNSDTLIMFKHAKCKHIFFKTKKNFFNSKIPCKECSKKAYYLNFKKVQEKINKKFGELFSIKEEYINMTTKIKITCNNCKTTKKISIKSLMQRKRCPHCKKEFL